MEPIVPRSQFRAEQFSSLCAIWELLFQKNVILLITRESVFIKKITEQNGPSVLKWNQLLRVPIHDRNRLVLYLWFKIKLYQKYVNPLSLFEEQLFLLVSCQQALSLRFATRGTFVLHCVFSQRFAFYCSFSGLFSAVPKEQLFPF